MTLCASPHIQNGIWIATVRRGMSDCHNNAKYVVEGLDVCGVHRNMIVRREQESLIYRIKQTHGRYAEERRRQTD